MNQNDQIVMALKRGEHLTPLTALKRFGTMKLSTRIGEIRYQHPELVIGDHWVRTATGKRVKCYWLEHTKPKKVSDRQIERDLGWWC